MTPQLQPLPPVCVLAGGLGTRLSARARETPKPLLPVAGRPFLFWVLDLLAHHRAHEVVLCVAHKGEQIESAVGDGAAFGLRVRTVHDGPQLAGTAGAIRGAIDLLGERFLVIYGDTYLRIDYRAVARAHADSGLPALMTVLHNEDAWDTSNARFADGLVLEYDKRAPTAAMQWIDYGLGALTPAALDAEPAASDLADVYHTLAAQRQLAGYEAGERFFEIGTPFGFEETEEFLRSQG